ncbi:hypothetical protein R1sor_005199 [Riccia sorocarpa]|uniref:Pex N-terminal domain-containing protein n=1 Tax=Riccia sorocarpa TaxID=122646 RepID=A0ABD3HIU4_9MARC
MLMQVGGEGMRPTFFEMAAAQHLPASMRAALLYSLGVMAQRRPILHKVLDYSDEAFSALILLLEAHSLWISGYYGVTFSPSVRQPIILFFPDIPSPDTSFAEALYGLRRRSAVPTSESSAVSNNRSNTEPGKLGAISRRHRNLSVLFLVGLPYLRSKMEAVYNAQRGGALQAAFWGIGDADSVGMESVGDASRNRDERLGSDATVLQRIRSRFLKLCVQIYRWVHASHEGLSFAYLYLLDATQFYSRALHFLGIQVTRASGQELMDASKQIAERRKREFERLRGSPVLKVCVVQPCLSWK